MVVRALTRKLLRDLWHTKSQGIAISLVIAAGIAMYVGYFSTFDSLRLAQRTYYDRFRFADVFVNVKRAPLHVSAQLAAIPGVSRVTTRVVMDVALDVPGLPEAATARLISIPSRGQPILNEPFLRRGRMPDPTRPEEVLASEGFALAHGFGPGDAIAATINGRRRVLRIAGIALSPEYIYSIRPGEMIPDNSRFGVFWMDQRALAAAFNMEGAFNDAVFTLMPGASRPEVIDAIDRILARYGSLGAIPRADQLSNWFVENELTQLQTMGFIMPAVFLGVSAFLLNVVLTRLIAVQREQIAALKALGYTNREIGVHYVSWSLAIAAGGALFGAIGGAWIGSSITTMYNDFFRFPTLAYVLAPATVIQATLISLVAAALGALSAVSRAIRLPPAEAMRPEPPARYRVSWIERVTPRDVMRPPVRMIVRNLQRQPVRAAVSVFGAALAVAILVVGMFSLDAIEVILDVQFNVSQRQDFTLAFVEPRPRRALHEIRHLPGVIDAEPVRIVPARLRAGHRTRKATITGIMDGARLQRVIDTSLRPVELPPDGLVLSTKLAELLNVRAGERVILEVLEGARPVRSVVISDLVDEYMGTSAYMDLDALHGLMREGPQMSAALLHVDGGSTEAFHRSVKRLPAVAGVSSTRGAIDNFRSTIAQNMNVMIFFNVLFSSVIAFGVVYNAARISLSERSRELASLRVIGFTRAEISQILLGELGIVLLVAVPAGLVLGYLLAGLLVLAFNTELYRFPLVVSARTYAFSALTVIVAAMVSGLVVRRRLDRLDLVAVLKTRE
jgi:putative ABC transport system permease protein